jgi:hypothetical protein
MNTGFKLLDNRNLRDTLERCLHRVGYTLGKWEFEQPLVTQLDIPLVPLGRGPTLLLRLEQGPHEDWEWGLLLNPDAGTELASFDWDTSSHYTTSCYQVWMEQIVAAVRAAGAG